MRFEKYSALKILFLFSLFYSFMTKIYLLLYGAHIVMSVFALLYSSPMLDFEIIHGVSWYLLGLYCY